VSDVETKTEFGVAYFMPGDTAVCEGLRRILFGVFVCPTPENSVYLAPFAPHQSFSSCMFLIVLSVGLKVLLQFEMVS
jgi:hypothetical protein